MTKIGFTDSIGSSLAFAGRHRRAVRYKISVILGTGICRSLKPIF
jgi:hypothetical protein